MVHGECRPSTQRGRGEQNNVVQFAKNHSCLVSQHINYYINCMFVSVRRSYDSKYFHLPPCKVISVYMKWGWGKYKKSLAVEEWGEGYYVNIPIWRFLPIICSCLQVAGYLEQILLHEFDLFIEDGSLDEVGALLCQYYALCASSSEQDILAQLRSLPRCDLSLCKCEDQDDQNLHR